MEIAFSILLLGPKVYPREEYIFWEAKSLQEGRPT
jgi:hypothetical protein